MGVGRLEIGHMERISYKNEKDSQPLGIIWGTCAFLLPHYRSLTTEYGEV